MRDFKIEIPDLSWLVWWGGAVWVFHQPGFGFWDALIWPYYIGRYIAVHFALLTGA